ncbi:acetyltransferase [Odoribacter sp. OttesenSCG-928-J03]|nr:acetyltransferase [Odoribacter sp. OttesenSCG-928-J03]
MTYCISNVSKEEYPELLRIWEASVRATHHFITEEDILFFKEVIPSYFDAVSLFAVRNREGRILGFLGTSDEAVEMLFISPEARGKGIGKILLRQAVNQLHLKKVDVNEQNEQAVGFYQHMGFSVINRSELDGSGKPYPILHMEYKGE